jgi:hypothetical protein
MPTFSSFGHAISFFATIFPFGFDDAGTLEVIFFDGAALGAAFTEDVPLDLAFAFGAADLVVPFPEDAGTLEVIFPEDAALDLGITFFDAAPFVLLLSTSCFV